MSDQTTISQRIRDFRAFCASNRIPYKAVTDRAGLSYFSVVNNMVTNTMSHERLDVLEQTATEICNEAKVNQ